MIRFPIRIPVMVWIPLLFLTLPLTVFWVLLLTFEIIEIR